MKMSHSQKKVLHLKTEKTLVQQQKQKKNKHASKVNDQQSSGYKHCVVIT